MQSGPAGCGHGPAPPAASRCAASPRRPSPRPQTPAAPGWPVLASAPLQRGGGWLLASAALGLLLGLGATENGTPSLCHPDGGWTSIEGACHVPTLHTDRGHPPRTPAPAGQVEATSVLEPGWGPHHVACLRPQHRPWGAVPASGGRALSLESGPRTGALQRPHFPLGRSAGSGVRVWIAGPHTCPSAGSLWGRVPTPHLPKALGS